MGSVAEEVVRLAPCSVFTVGGSAACEVPAAVRRLVVPVDRSAHASQAARHAAELALTYGASMTLLHVLDAASLPTTTGPILGLPMVAADEIVRRSEQALRQRAEALQEAFPALGPVETVVRVGRPASDIVDFAQEVEAGLLVLGSHGRSGLRRLLIGGVAGQVVRTAPCPVFTVKSFGRSLLPDDADAAHEAA